jgi:hypothetical protein
VRVCACGCGESLAGRDKRALYATAACRARGWKRDRDYGPQKPPKVRTNARQRSGLQVSYKRAVREVEAEFRELGVGFPRARATRAVRRALSDKQRARLDARGDL